MPAEEKARALTEGRRAAGASTIAAALLLVSKWIAGVLSGSIALLADALHSLSDVATGAAVWFGLRLSMKEPTESFPYGYYKAETLASLLVSLVIVLSGVQILLESVRRIIAPSPVSLTTLALLVAGSSSLLSYMLARYKSRVGKKINSQALMSEGKHSMVDVYLSLIVLAGILTSSLGILWIEPLAGLLIGAVVVRFGLGSGRDAALVLMDACLKPEHIQEITAAASSVQGVVGVHNVKIRRSGPYIFGDLHLELDEGTPFEKTHKISDEVEQRIKERIVEVDSITIHIEPRSRGELRVAIPVSEDYGLRSTPSHHFAEAPYFLMVDLDRKRFEVGVWQRTLEPSLSGEKASPPQSFWWRRRLIDS
ncbi:cation diffusion facilitator family transporter [Candidatus Bathyarchaeota archaeon]|nr:cation diffusion facilitator family transporter [Candidatus Bathyarchaeota archaeon]